MGHCRGVNFFLFLRVSLSQELIESAEPAREHVTSTYCSINGKIQTWWPYVKVVLPVYGVLDL